MVSLLLVCSPLGILALIPFPYAALNKLQKLESQRANSLSSGMSSSSAGSRSRCGWRILCKVPVMN